MSNHYIRTNADGVVVLAFSDAFVDPLETDILVVEGGPRHYNPQITNDFGQPIYRWDGDFVPIEPAALPPVPPTLEDRTKANEDAINFLLGAVIL